MGKATPFEGELDAFGNPMCGQSFMAGTICSRPPKHDGFCGAECQNCGGDWINGTCECVTPTCSECNDDLMIEAEVEEGMCAECMLAATEPSVIGSAEPEISNDYTFNHADYLSEPTQQKDWCGQKFHYERAPFECRRRIGHEGPHGCRGADDRRQQVIAKGPTPHELAEAYRSLGVELPRCANCMEPLIWHEGNGGQWLGADPPRDWTTCRGVPDGLKHAPPV